MDRRTALRHACQLVLHCTCFVLRSTGIPDRTRPDAVPLVQPRADRARAAAAGWHGLAIQPVPRVRGSPLARLLPACHWPSWSMGREYHGSTAPHPPARQPGAVVYNATQWTTSRLPLWPGQHVVLSNRFSLQNFVFFYYYRYNGIRDVSRVKVLTLKDGASAYGIEVRISSILSSLNKLRGRLMVAVAHFKFLNHPSVCNLYMPCVLAV